MPGVYLVWGGVCSRGVYLVWGVYLAQGGAPSPGVSAPGGVSAPRGVYLVRYSPSLWTDTRLLKHNLRNFVVDGNEKSVNFR